MNSIIDKMASVEKVVKYYLRKKAGGIVSEYSPSDEISGYEISSEVSEDGRIYYTDLRSSNECGLLDQKTVFYYDGKPVLVLLRHGWISDKRVFLVLEEVIKNEAEEAIEVLDLFPFDFRKIKSRRSQFYRNLSYSVDMLETTDREVWGIESIGHGITLSARFCFSWSIV